MQPNIRTLVKLTKRYKICFFPFPWQQTSVNSRKHLFLNVHVRWTLGKYRVFLCSQEFSCIFWDSGFGLIQENASFLAFTVQLMDGKLREFQHLPLVFSHFVGQCIWVFLSAHWLVLFALSHPLSHDQLATNIQWTKAHSPSQSEKQTQMALLILGMIYLKSYSAVSFQQTYNYSCEIRGQFSTLKNKIITINSLARKFFHLTLLKKTYLQDLFDRRAITNPWKHSAYLTQKTEYDFVQVIQLALYCSYN